MTKLIEDIAAQSDWLVKAFEDDGLKLDYSIKSLVEVDRFFLRNTKNGKPKRGGRLATRHYSTILFSIGAYIGQTIIQHVPGASWETDDEDPAGAAKIQVRFPDGMSIWPVLKVGKRFKLGMEEAIYPYVAVLLGPYLEESLDNAYWTAMREEEKEEQRSTPWWKFW